MRHFARWLDLQNRMSLKEVQAVPRSLKYSRTARVRRRVRPRPRRCGEEQKWADERLLMIDMRPPPQPKKKVEAPAPAPPVSTDVLRAARPAAEPLFGRTSEPKEQPAPAEEEAPLAAGDVLRVHGRAPPRRPTGRGGGGRRRRSGAGPESGLLLAEGRSRCQIPHLRPPQAQQLSLIETRCLRRSPRPRGRGRRRLQRRWGVCCAFRIDVAAMLDPEGGAARRPCRASPPNRNSRQTSRLKNKPAGRAPDETPRK